MNWTFRNNHIKRHNKAKKTYIDDGSEKKEKNTKQKQNMVKRLKNAKNKKINKEIDRKIDR